MDASNLISTVEYAKLHGKKRISVFNRIERGDFKTAIKLGKCWYIDKDEPYPDDSRVKSGKYVDWREKHPSADAGTKEEER